MAKLDSTGISRLIEQRINPESDFHPDFTELHGIRRQDVQECPTIGDFYSQVFDELNNQVVFTWKRFDGRVIDQLSEKYGLQRPDCVMIDASKFANQTLGSHPKLEDHAAALGIVFNPHQAIEDAAAELRVIEKGLSKIPNFATLLSLLIDCSYDFKSADASQHSTSIPRGMFPEKVDPAKYSVNTASEHFGKKYYFTGTWRDMSKSEVVKFLAGHGFESLPRHLATMDFLIKGDKGIGEGRIKATEKWIKKKVGKSGLWTSTSSATN